ncbi:hypothetical protein Tco_0705539 [Tanacetum coccineum]|uniref:Uncharacterized protein n=1 Tax=Tanacetum coccineum TaxID=301880 RepID=A0ABQ4Y6E0_9ASTR
MPQRLTKSSIYSRSLGLAACASFHRNALGMEGIANMALIQLGGVGSRVDEMILARVLSGFAGEKVWDDIQVVLGFCGRERGLLGK